MDKNKMDDMARRECSSERTKVIHNSTVLKDQTLVTVACSLDGADYCKIGKNGDPSEIQYTEKVKAALETLGPIGGKSIFNDCDFIVGRCAEPHAAHKILQSRQNKHRCISDLVFGTPYRSRTKCKKAERILLKDGKVEKHTYCNNCKRAFNL